ERWYRVSVIAFLLALLAKVTVIVLPLILIPAAWRERQRFDRSFALRLAPYFALSIIFGIIALFGKQGNASLLLDKILIGSKAAIFYLTHLFWPVGFSVLYPYTSPISTGNPDLLIPLILMIAITAGVILSPRLLRGSRDVVFGWFFFLLLLLPTFANFAKGKDILRDVYFASDRYAYLASIGMLFIIVLTFDALYRKIRVPVIALSVVVIVLLSFLSYRQSLTWYDTETLFQTVLASYPNSHLAHNNLGSLAYRRGDLKTAATEYAASLSIRPNSAAYFNLGQMYAQLKLPDRAMDMYRKALEQNPDDRDSLVNLGVLLLNAARVNESIAVLEHARDVDDRFAPVFFNLGLAYEKAGRRDDAISAYRRAFSLDPAGEAAALERLRVLGE
ncbi:tetratricopeptide repeat protein, partial [Candidatus Uhrbacteria bacterium]|nr:tetratricopeptide repeat protein [Candidatus Uhrbacteria bacterium]